MSVGGHIVGDLEHEEVQHVGHVMVLDGEGVGGESARAHLQDAQLEATQTRGFDLILNTNDLDELLMLWRGEGRIYSVFT